MSSSSVKKVSSAKAFGSDSKKRKQGSLFSFFSKKPNDKGTASSSSSLTKIAKNAACTPDAVETTPVSNKVSTTTTTAKAPSKKGASFVAPKRGTALRIYWPDDGQYYRAVVTTSTPNSSMVTVTYDNAQVEKIDLLTEKYQILKDDEDQTTKTKTASSPTDSNRRKRRTIQEESEEEFEFDDYDDASEYEDDGKPSAMDEDEEEEKNWIVSDEEDEMPARKKPKKIGRKTTVKVTKVSSTKTPSKKLKSSESTSLSQFKSPSSSAKSEASFKSPGSSQARPKTVTPNSSTPSSAIKAVPIMAAAATSQTSSSGAPLPYRDKVVNPAGSHIHNHLKFLRNPCDRNGRNRSHPEYDPSTLRVSEAELKKHYNGKLSAGMKQWWDIKSHYFDTVLLFKTGKFYEMHHMDADVGVRELGFCYMKGAAAHAGFPEAAYGTFTAKLVERGYKVARVEQTETPDQLKERKKNRKKGQPAPGVVNREVCSIMTLGTRTYCYMDAELAADESGGGNTGPLLAIKEVVLDQDGQKLTTTDGDNQDEVAPVCEYGIVVVDAVHGNVTVGQFADDVLRSRMHTLLTRFQPSEILIEAGDAASQTLVSLLKSYQSTTTHSCRMETIPTNASSPPSTALSSTIRRQLERGSVVHPWDVQETLREIHRRGYYPRGSRQDETLQSTTRWPKVLHMCVEGGADLALSSFGAALFYLQRSLIDVEILGMGIVHAYIPPPASGTMEAPGSAAAMTQIAQSQGEHDTELDVVPPMTPQAPPVQQEQTATAGELSTNHLALDGTTLQNLEILTNSANHTPSGSLWSRINYTKTPHGARMLRAWLLRPLFKKADIDRRADAVAELTSGCAAVALSETMEILQKCGDMERLLSRVHSMGANSSSDDPAPSNRAVLYEGKKHTRRKVGDFSKILQGLRQSMRILDLFEGIDIQSGLLRKIVQPMGQGGCFPLMDDELRWFEENFDCEQAANGLFEPSRGVDEDYDAACDAIDRIKGDLEEYKDEMCREVLRSGARTAWKYVNTKPDSKDKYLIELPASMPVPEDFIMKAKRGKGAKQINKYRTAVVQQLVDELEQAIVVQTEGKAQGMQLMFAKFDSKRSLWAAAAQCTAMLDALGSLAKASGKPGYARPQILDCNDSQSPCIHVVEGRHPCVDVTHCGGEFIPNDLTLGAYEDAAGAPTERVLLLSGPNMGGKSTLLRQTCLIVILAQVGCYVPATECSLTPVDRIFTRLGASDRILMGQSTFFVELAETAGALRGATRRSLVIMDELGRGTSTFDGTAIASACVEHLVNHNQCLTLFATHYHSLLEEWKEEPSVRLGHMQCFVEGGVDDQNEANEEPAKEHNITFLYTLGEGACPKSFGINVAKLAGLPDNVLRKAKEKSAEFEEEMKGTTREADGTLGFKTKVQELLASGDVDELTRLWEAS